MLYYTARVLDALGRANERDNVATQFLEHTEKEQARATRKVS